MAQTYQIDLASHQGPTKPLAKFTDESVVPHTLRECAIPSDQAGEALRYLHRVAQDHEDLVALLDAVLGEG